ncbi:MAG: sterol desaturase family protein, partial [bacterium]|nr:sterol desaturase family protein [bacterium]
MQHEALVRLGCFFGVFAVMAVWELASSRRALTSSKALRWFGNLSVVVVSTLVVKLFFPIAAVGLADLARQRGWGLLNVNPLPYWQSIVLSVVVLDLVIYLQHVMFHAVPMLWRFHMMHHADLDLDVSSGLRFHPVEIVLSMGIKMAAVVLLGPPVLAVVLFEVVLNATAMFNHGNVRIPLGLDRILRLIVVTPDMHRVHHSIEPAESNSNFGFNLPWWDR